MRRRASSALGALSCAAILACGGGGGGGSSIPANVGPQAPTALKASQNPQVFDEADLAWTPPPGNFDGYELEMQEGSGAFQKLTDGLLSPAYRGAIISFNDAIPEMTDYHFRIRTVLGALDSPYSNQADYLRGVRPPQTLYGGIYPGGALEIHWTNSSLIATQAKVDRAVVNANGIPGTFTHLASLPASTNQYLDDQLAEGTTYRYQVTLVAGTVASIPTRTDVQGPPILPPSNLQAVAGPGGVTLSWTNRSSKVTSLTVEKVEGFPSGGTTGAPTVLGGDATSWVDSDVLPGKSYRYRLGASDGSTWMDSLPVQVVVPPAPGIISFDAGLLSLPSNALWVQALANGRWVVLQGAAGSTALAQDANGAWVPFDLSNARRSEHPFLIDPQGMVHMVLMRTVGLYGTQRNITHAWFDGSTWNEELISQFTPPGAYDPLSVWSAIAGDGTLHAAWQTSMSSGALNIVHGFRTPGGSWATAPLTSALIDPVYTIGPISMAATPDGTLGVEIQNAFKLIHMHRASTGSWSEEIVPTGALWGGLTQALAMGFGTSRFTDCFQIPNPADPMGSLLQTRTWSGTAWSSAQTVLPLGNEGVGWLFASAWTPDGSRKGILMSHSPALVTWGAATGWSATDFSETPATVGFGLLPSNKFYIVTAPFSDSSTMWSYALFTESP